MGLECGRKSVGGRGSTGYKARTSLGWGMFSVEKCLEPKNRAGQGVWELFLTFHVSVFPFLFLLSMLGHFIARPDYCCSLELVFLPPASSSTGIEAHLKGPCGIHPDPIWIHCGRNKVLYARAQEFCYDVVTSYSLPTSHNVCPLSPRSKPSLPAATPFLSSMSTHWPGCLFSI